MYDGFGVARRQSNGCCMISARRSPSSPHSRPLRARSRELAAVLRTSCSTSGALILNKTLPDSLLDPQGAAASASFADQAGPIADALAALPDPALADPARTARVLRTIADSYANFSVVAMREAELRAGSPASRCRCYVPGFEHDISDIESLLAICDGTSSIQNAPRYDSRSTRDLERLRTRLGGTELVHLERLVAGWRPLADLSFADLVLLAPIAGEEGHRFVVLAQVRPSPARPIIRRTSSAPSSTRSSAPWSPFFGGPG